MALTINSIEIQAGGQDTSIAPNDTVVITVNVTNETGYKIVSFDGGIFYSDTSTTPLPTGRDVTTRTDNNTCNILNGATADVTITVSALDINDGVFAWLTSHDMRGVLGLRLAFSYVVVYSGSSRERIAGQGASLPNVSAIMNRYSPSITIPSDDEQMCKRCDDDGTLNDEGEYALLTAKVNLVSTPTSNQFAASLLVFDMSLPDPADRDTPILTIDDTSNPGFTSSLSTGVVDSDVLIDALVDNDLELSSNKEYSIVLYYDDGYEFAVYPYSISRAFANIHLSGSGAGVAFGKYCKDTGASADHPEDALFECAYHAEFNNGITVVGGAKGANVYDDTQEVDTGDTWIDGNRIMRAVFSDELSSIDSSRIEVVGTLLKTPTAVLRIFGSAYRPGGIFYSLPYVNSSVSNSSLGVYVNSANGEVSLVVASGYAIDSSHKMGYSIIVEYAAND